MNYPSELEQKMAEARQECSQVPATSALPSIPPDAIEREIVAKGLTAPRVKPSDIYANIASCHYFTAQDGAFFSGGGHINGGEEAANALGVLTFCVLVLRNGFTVTGESACASPENFDAEIGRKIARDNAISKVWPLMGYELRSRLADI